MQEIFSNTQNPSQAEVQLCGPGAAWGTSESPYRTSVPATVPTALWQAEGSQLPLSLPTREAGGRGLGWRHTSSLDTDLTCIPGGPCPSWGLCHRWAIGQSENPGRCRWSRSAAAGGALEAPLQTPALLLRGEGPPDTRAGTVSGAHPASADRDSGQENPSHRSPHWKGGRSGLSISPGRRCLPLRCALGQGQPLFWDHLPISILSPFGRWGA